MKPERIAALRKMADAPSNCGVRGILIECLDAIEMRDKGIRRQQGIIAEQNVELEMLREQAMGDDL